MSQGDKLWPGVKGSTASGGHQGRQVMRGPLPMKLFGAWEVDKTPANCIPRLCTVTINQLILTKSFLASCSGDSSSLVIAVKMSSSKRTLRSNEISVHGVTVATTPPSNMSSSITCPVSNTSGNQANNISMISVSSGVTAVELSSISLLNQTSSPATTACTVNEGMTTSPVKTSSVISNFQSQQQQPNLNQQQQVINLDLTFALQYPHFLKKNGNQLQILLQRRKRYKNRAMLGYKTLAGGVINMAEVLQKSHHMKKELDLRENIKDSLSSSTRILKSEVVAKIIMSSLKSQPVDHESTSAAGMRGKIINTVNPASNGSRIKGSLNESADVESDDEVLDEFSPSDASDSEADAVRGGVSVGDGSRSNRATGSSSRSKWMNVRRRHSKKSHHRNPSASLDVDAEGNTRSVHNRNLKQKFIALLKKFKIPDSEASDSEEAQAALENELMIANASCDQLANIEDIFEFEDSDVDSIQDFDDFSVSSTPRPGLKPFFSSKTTLVEEVSYVVNAIPLFPRALNVTGRLMHASLPCFFILLFILFFILFYSSQSENAGKRLGSGHSSEERDFPVTSSPKPSLRPFFSSKTTLVSSHETDVSLSVILFFCHPLSRISLYTTCRDDIRDYSLISLLL